MSELPKKMLLRRGEVIAFLGVNRHTFAKLVAGGVLTRQFLNGKGRAFFKRSEVLKVGGELDNSVSKG